MKVPLELKTKSEDETREIGRRLGAVAEPGDLIGLYGPLGAGKTCLVRGLAEGLGISAERVRSPSFTLVATYSGGRLPLFHIDLYRMEPTADDRMALREYLYGSGVCVVEWFDHFGEPAEHLAVTLAYAGIDERRISLHASGGRFGRLMEAVKNQVRC